MLLSRPTMRRATIPPSADHGQLVISLDMIGSAKSISRRRSSSDGTVRRRRPWYGADGQRRREQPRSAHLTQAVPGQAAAGAGTRARRGRRPARGVRRRRHGGAAPARRPRRRTSSAAASSASATSAPARTSRSTRAAARRSSTPRASTTSTTRSSASKPESQDGARASRSSGSRTRPRPSGRSSCGRTSTFHNGKPFTADDVIYSLRLDGRPEARRALRGGEHPTRSSSRRSTTLTVQIPLKSPNARLSDSFVNGNTVMVQDGETNFTKPVGTGPFKFESFTPGERSHCVRTRTTGRRASRTSTRGRTSRSTTRTRG